MSSPDIQRLREIKTFPSLVKYLRDELDWPIESDDFDELTFEYEPDELGIDSKTAVKIKEIKQLRPLSSKQPWGIFFINFEPKQLPIVVLRRILRSLVVKKRASANKSHQAAWQLHDLLFISSYGETDHREITFAHFSEPTDRLFGDLPTLRVLGWDDDDTKLKIDHVVHTLSGKLRWPGDEDDTEAWRKKWSDAFELRPREVITTSKGLAVRLADLAKSIRQRANLILRIESERGPLRMLHKAFQTALIHDLSEDDFADMYAQTIAYGLLAARVSRPVGVIADNLADMIPTNPFLKDMLGTFLTVGGRKGKIDFDELGIQEVVDLLNNPDTHIEDVLRDFGKKTMQEDPVIHFYELFLNEYDKKKKVQRGVFYTPQPVVSYIVRSVHELLKTEFGLEDGLASTVTWGGMVKRNPEIKIPEGVSPDEPFVLILDIATGTATFLVEIIDVIYKTMTEKWLKEGHMALEMPKLWNKYVPKHLLPRLYGFELMMAPYAIAHMKIGLKLAETGYRFGSNERAHIYLTNSLEPPSDAADQPQFEEMAPALAHEAKAVNTVKRNKYFTVVVGNPPYSILSANLSDTARRIVDPYRYVDGQKIEERSMLRLEMHLQDDYVKFLALAQSLISQVGIGILGFITNNGYLDNLTLRGVRFALLKQFNRLMLANLHGSRLRQSHTGEAAGDQNVFDIEQGVAVIWGIATSSDGTLAAVDYAEFIGTREKKYEALQRLTFQSSTLQPIKPQSPQFFLVLRDESAWPEYQQFIPLTDAMPVNISGIVTAHDDLVIDFKDDRLIENVRVLKNTDLSDDEARSILRVKDNAGWKLAKARLEVRRTKTDQLFLKPYSYRPFDTRRIYYHPVLVWCDRRKVMGHVLAGGNVALATCRQLAQGPWEHVFVTRELQDDSFISNRTRERSYHFPLHLKGPGQQRGAQSELLLGHNEQRANFSGMFIDAVARKLGLSLDSATGLPRGLMPEAIFYFSYSVFHSPSYRTRYAEFLKIDFPRLPLTTSLELFKSLAKLGSELVDLHLMESLKLESYITKLIGKGNNEVVKGYPKYNENTVFINPTQGFQGVSENVWNFHIGGYQVCEKWLKDRRGRTLSKDDIEHYQKIIVAINETIRLMKEIDKVIEAHGGWPGAFLTKEKEASGYDVQPQPVLKAAEEIPEYKKQKSSTTHPKIRPLEKDWRKWLALSQWAKETMRINSYWIDFAHEIGNSLQEGKPLTDKQKEDMGKCWQQAVNKGFKP